MKRFLTAAAVAAMAMIGTTAHAQSFTLTGTVRDFLYNGTPTGTYNGNVGTGHIDFENVVADDKDIVASTLGSDGKPVYNATGSNIAGSGGTTHGAAAFNQWYNNTAGVNLSSLLTITATQSAPNVYTYNNPLFFPIDGQGFGNQGASHNYGFTFELNTEFDYVKGVGQNFTYSGDDDVWVFINGKLAIDLGGVHFAQSQSVDMDTFFGAAAAGTYKLDIFTAERHTNDSTARFDTNIVLRNAAVVPEANTAALWSAALPMIGTVALARRSRRKAVSAKN